jgi:3-deoxy-D-manno-octulosonic-acid transferase
MSPLYIIVSFLLAAALTPILLLIIGRKKYRLRLLPRLGFGLGNQLKPLIRRPASAPTFWVHALSVGEVTSALPLVRGMREAFPLARIVFSATTGAGHQVARRLISPWADALIAAPLDIGPVVPLFIRHIRPDLFILVETDFWPHWLHCLARRGTPMLLVNGRISEKSFAQYRRWSFFFRPMFRTFTLLSMQTAADAEKMAALDIAAGKVVTLGNLKFDTSQISGAQADTTVLQKSKQKYGFDPAAPLWICGSTHRGEEEPIFRIFLQLRTTVPGLQLLLAPRNIERAEEIASLARSLDLDCRLWTQDNGSPGPVLLLDTIGALAASYALADVVFVGGSLVAAGGHNPIEPAAAGVPVLFGPHMEDFAEIAGQLVQCGGARQIDGEAALLAALRQLYQETALHRAMAAAARQYVRANQGVVEKHIKTIKALLPAPTPGG